MDRDWRCQKYGPLGWMESFVKLLAVGVGIASLSIYNNSDKIFRSTRVAQMVLMGIAGVGLILLVVQRVLDKELFAIGFIVLQVIGHWVMFLVLVLSINPGAFLFTYVFLMLLGEYIKLMFLVLAENPEVRFLNKPMLFGITGLFTLLWVGILIVQIVIWLVEY